MKIVIKDLLSYFDVARSTEVGDTTAAISVVGEDLGAALFEHYCERRRKWSATVIDSNEATPVTGRQKGPRLDRWILVAAGRSQILYQVEIKNWCSRAIGGESIPVDIDRKELAAVVKKQWKRSAEALDARGVNSTNKVLIDMKSDARLKINGRYRKEPLLILWDARSPAKKISCFSRYTVLRRWHHFDHCWIFSCSLYLRELRRQGERVISLEMPNAERRLKDLVRVFRVKGVPLS